LRQDTISTSVDAPLEISSIKYSQSQDLLLALGYGELICVPFFSTAAIGRSRLLTPSRGILDTSKE
jgi:hypothetical protein